MGTIIQWERTWKNSPRTTMAQSCVGFGARIIPFDPFRPNRQESIQVLADQIIGLAEAGNKTTGYGVKPEQDEVRQRLQQVYHRAKALLE